MRPQHLLALISALVVTGCSADMTEDPVAARPNYPVWINRLLDVRIPLKSGEEATIYQVFETDGGVHILIDGQTTHNVYLPHRISIVGVQCAGMDTSL